MQMIARALSVLGHPVLLMPLAVWLALHERGAAAAVHALALGLTVGVALAVIGFSLAKVKRGRWRHVDATVPAERLQLNAFAIVLMGGCALAAWPLARPVALGLAAGALLLAAALALRRWLHLSLHAGFGALAVALAWPRPGAMAALMLLVAGVCWSRLVLGRHRPADIVAGLAAGALAGIGFVLLA